MQAGKRFLVVSCNRTLNRLWRIKLDYSRRVSDVIVAGVVRHSSGVSDVIVEGSVTS